MHRYWVYILTNEHNGVLYIGVTGNLSRRIYQHREGAVEGFTKTYNVKKLVYFEEMSEISAAIEREKQLKKGPRKREVELIQSLNPGWNDLFDQLIDL